MHPVATGGHTGLLKEGFLLALFQSDLPCNQDVDFDALARLPAFNSFVPQSVLP